MKYDLLFSCLSTLFAVATVVWVIIDNRRQEKLHKKLIAHLDKLTEALEEERRHWDKDDWWRKE